MGRAKGEESSGGAGGGISELSVKFPHHFISFNNSFVV